MRRLSLIVLVAGPMLFGLDVLMAWGQGGGPLPLGALAAVRLPWLAVPLLTWVLVARRVRPGLLTGVGYGGTLLFVVGWDWGFYALGTAGSGFHVMAVVLSIVTGPAVLPLLRRGRMAFYAVLASAHLVLDGVYRSETLRAALSLDCVLLFGGLCLAWMLEGLNESHRKQFFLRQEVEQALRSLHSSRARIIAAARMVAGSAQALTATLADLSLQAVEVRTEAGRISEASAQVASSAGALVRQSRSSAAQADEAQRHTGHVDTLVGRLEAGMTDISKAVTHSTHSVRQLEESSERIGGFVEMIRELSTTTSLLAINATIEAARAGEHGQGFAVVAREVQRLGEESGRGSARIAQVVSGVTQQMAGALRTVAQIGETTERFTPVLESARTTLRAIRDSVVRNQEVLVSSSSEADQQAEQITLISMGCARLLELAEAHASMTADVTATALQLDGLAEELRRLLPEGTGGEAGRG